MKLTLKLRSMAVGGPVGGLDDVARAADRIDALEDALRTVLLFHQGVWTPANSALWRERTGEDSASTRTLCDYIRRTLGEVDGTALPAPNTGGPTP